MTKEPAGTGKVVKGRKYEPAGIHATFTSCKIADREPGQ